LKNDQKDTLGDFIGVAVVAVLVALVEKLQNRIQGGKW